MSFVVVFLNKNHRTPLLWDPSPKQKISAARGLGAENRSGHGAAKSWERSGVLVLVFVFFVFFWLMFLGKRPFRVYFVFCFRFFLVSFFWEKPFGKRPFRGHV